MACVVNLSGKQALGRIRWTQFSTSAGVASADTLTILHTNDFHSKVEPISKYDSPCSVEDNAAGECFGGYARLVTAIESARAKAGQDSNAGVLLVDGGDQFQGSLFYTYYKGKVAAEMMNTLGYDAMTVGNHEFDDGPVVLRAFADTVNFPVLMSNGDVANEPQLAGKILKSTVIEKGGERYGLIGLTPENTGELASPGRNVTFSDPVSAVQGEVDKLQADGVNRIIVLSHSGYRVDQRVAAETSGVDVIVGGHSNTLLSNTDEDAAGPYPTMVGDTAIVQAYAYGKYLGELSVTFDDDGVIAEVSGDPIIIDGQVVEDEATLFQNTLSTFSLTGADIVAALENGVSEVEEVAGRFPQVAGLQYVFDLSKPVGERIIEVLVAGDDGFAPIDPEATYGVVSNDYVRKGGDGYSVFAERASDVYDYGPSLDAVVADYLAASGSYVPSLDGRIAAR